MMSSHVAPVASGMAIEAQRVLLSGGRPKLQMTRSEINSLIVDLWGLGYCIADIAELSGQTNNYVDKALSGEHLPHQPKPGRMARAVGEWVRDVECHIWASIYLRAYERFRNRGHAPPPGVTLRDATLTADWKFGSLEMMARSRRARMVLLLTKVYLEGEVEFRVCGECQFVRMYFLRPYIVGDSLPLQGAHCPACAALEKGKHELRAKKAAPSRSARPRFEDLFGDE